MLQKIITDTSAALDTAFEHTVPVLNLRQTGTVTHISSGIARVRGLPDVNSEELLVFPGGLLGMAFSPDYETDRRVYLANTDDTGGDTTVARFTVDRDRTRIVESTSTTVIEVDQPRSTHNGGMIAFDRDGMLLVGLGDGGGSSSRGNAQDTTDNLLGSILRLDVVGRPGGGYAVPADNPFVGRTGDDEIWVHGVRNPWRFDVDPATGDVWIGDVGQGSREELDLVAAGTTGPVNLGWPLYEGSRPYDGGSTSGLTFPVFEYDHGDGDRSITLGGVMRGPSAGAAAGDVVIADFVSGRVWVYDPDTDRRRDVARVSNVFGSGRDAEGEVYVTTASTVFRVEGSGTRFRDVAAGSTFAADIEALAAEGVTRGCDPPANERFCPDALVTREQMAAFVRRAEGLARRDEPFTDVSDDSVFAGDIGAIAAAGITRGCDPPATVRFCPTDVVTREQMAAFVRRARGLPAAGESFRDVSSSNPFAADIGAIQAAGITRGCNPPADDRFCPRDPVTRAQMAAFVVRAWDL